MTRAPALPPRSSPGRPILRVALALPVLLAAMSGPIAAAAAPSPAIPAPATAAPAPMPRDVILDTDIGDDIDDAFALALLLSSPELRVDFIAASFGDTTLRARLLERFLHAAGRTDIAVGIGPSTPPATRFTQGRWASAASPPARFPDAVDAILRRLRAAPAGSVTLIALAPLTTVRAMIDRDPGAFRRLARVVVMGGSIRRGYGRHAGETSARPSDEYNVRCDPAGWRALLSSGVAVEIMPLDATEIALEAPRRERLFAAGRLGPVLKALYREWAHGNPWGNTPTLFDVVPVARLLRPGLCRPTPLRIDVTGRGATEVVAGAPNASACLDIDRAAVLDLLDQRLRPGRGRGR